MTAQARSTYITLEFGDAFFDRTAELQTLRAAGKNVDSQIAGVRRLLELLECSWANNRRTLAPISIRRRSSKRLTEH